MNAIFTFFTQGASLGFSAAASPGPFQAFLLSRSARVGPRRALTLALAPLVSDGPVVAIVLVLLASAPAWLLRGLGVSGGLLLLWLAWGAWRTAGEVHLESHAQAEGSGGLWRAAVVNAAGPGPWIFWSTVCGPILVEAWRASPPRALAFLAGFYLVLVGGNAALVLAAGWAGRIGPRAARALSLASAALMAGMGVLQLWRGIAGR